MILPPEYNWLESYLDNDMLWLEESLNWDEAFDLILSDFTFISSFFISFFLNSNFFLDSLIKLSFFDIIFLIESNKNLYSKELYNLFILDLMSIVYNKFFILQFLFYSDYQDYILILIYYSPELILALNDYITIYWLNSAINETPSVVFDLFSDTLNSSISEFVEYFIMFFFLFDW